MMTLSIFVINDTFKLSKLVYIIYKEINYGQIGKSEIRIAIYSFSCSVRSKRAVIGPVDIRTFLEVIVKSIFFYSLSINPTICVITQI